MARVSDRRWFCKDPRRLAQDLLGMVLVRVLDDGTRLAGRIVETEAYLGVEDRAAHSFGGHRSPRNESMYARAGTAYVYFTYGMHHCFNVVCGKVDEPVAVLVRALEPLEGIEHMRGRRTTRRRRSPLREVDLCSGPGKLCQALDIDRSLDGEDLCASPRLFIERTARVGGGVGPIEPERIRVSARIGVESAGVWARRPLRWFCADSPHVSRR